MKASCTFAFPPLVLFLLLVVLVFAQTLCSAQNSDSASTEGSGNAPQQSAEEFRVLGDQQLKENKYEESIASYTKAIDIAASQNKEEYINYYKRAAVYLLRNKNQLALTDLNRVLELKPDFVQAKIRRGKLLLSFGRTEKAREDFQDILALQPDNDVALKQIGILEQYRQFVDQAKELLAKNDLLQARSTLSEALDLCSDSIEARTMRATINLQLKEYNVVIEDTMRILKIQPNNIDALWMRGKAFYYFGQNDAAINHFKEGLKYDPDNSKCRTEFKKIKKTEKATKDGETFFSQGKYQEALEQYQLALETDPDHPLTIPGLKTSICKCYVKMRKAAEARDSCSEALKLDEGLVDAWLNRGEAYILLEDYDKAIFDFQRAQERDQRNHQAHEGLNRARRLQKMASRKDYYKILGVTKQASNTEIKKAFRQLAKEWHPDKADDKEVAEVKYREINEAYEILSDEEKRTRYDNGEDIQLDGQFHQNPFQNPFGGGPFSFHFNFGGR